MNYKVVIVNYMKSGSVEVLLDQLDAQTLSPNSVSLIDNSPEFELSRLAGKAYGFPVDIKHFPSNLGYSRACNIGASGEWDYVVFLNPDIEVREIDLFEKLAMRAGTLHDVGCIGVAQKNPDGSYEPVARKYPTIAAIAGKRIPSLRKLLGWAVDDYMQSYPACYEPTASPLSVDWLQSSFLAVPRDAWQVTSGFDERFFVFMADVEYGRRCKKYGKNSYLMRDLEVHADGLRSSAGGLADVLKKKTVRIHIRDAVRYYFGI
ncbi:glycosyltransferase family 2 protein [Luteimonas sp. RC10]|uniref:glycosyltransferase family 2 protein n=1 Tax=Luteimonas sp. RC10 TaxID=2587035 RepID=UPI001620954F|nr:glycosyltransferase family 2 protein [Luteimonas sp. RC10]MBB3344867.1 GT2 family glycosyltransferase [Luteimonas sp. RC10]